MLYLVDEMFRQTGKDLHIVFGKGYDWDLFDKSKTPIEWADWLKSKSYELAKYLPDQNKKINFDQTVRPKCLSGPKLTEAFNRKETEV